jgi:hypothetical protein
MELSSYSHIFNIKPCSDAIEWLMSQPDARTAWLLCQRGDRLWWALRHSSACPEKAISVEFAKWCASRAKKHADAYAAYAAYDAADAATAADAAAAAAAAVAAAAAYAAYAAAYAKERKFQANWIRKNIPMPECFLAVKE